MTVYIAILIGLKEVWTHKFRSVLTMLGIVLGVSSLVAMAAIVKGMENGMKEAMIAMGGLNKVLIREQEVPASQEHLRDLAPGRTLRDVMALKASAPLLTVVSPEMAVYGAVVSRAGKDHYPSEVVGAWPQVLDMNLYEIEHGRFFTDLDEEYAQSVCVIGTGIRDELFGNPHETGHEIIPIGERIQISGQPFTIVGMFKHYESEKDQRQREAAKKEPKSEGNGNNGGVTRQRGWRSKHWDAFWRKNNVVYLPLNTAWVKFRSASGRGGIPEPKLSDIDIKVKDLGHLEAALQQARNVLLMTHNGIEDFTFETQENRLEDINLRIRNARISGGIIAGLSLLVGGIGIMNIMLASITERIREIGTCKAIGASPTAIFLQVLVEGCVLAGLGGLAGITASFGLVAFLDRLSEGGNAPVITLMPMVAAVVFSMTVGLVASLLPAIKAARLAPIQALRYG
ncbi:MAG: ABC transporter permease [Verrucomicrobiales bacterium]|nr:ABC transporter permease [Verrucomicrobiales bacterium]